MVEEVTTDETVESSRGPVEEPFQEEEGRADGGTTDLQASLRYLEVRGPTWSPYFAGVGLGITLLLAYWFLGTGLGASGGVARFAAWVWHGLFPRHVEGSAYFGDWFHQGGPHVLHYHLVFMVVGVFVGGLLSALGSGRIQPMVERGPQISPRGRLWFALAGGALVGFASRLARGCSATQGLTGTALLFTGSAVFLACIFIGGYAAAYFLRREWI
ncbi:MAG: YeeE/YedE thiosulfate transporter family protein [Desulfatiglandales bacterium]